ncbi:hypothetical protein MGU_11164 [Metarhizium guizhouense ARSEF 977]|uniref:Uncharacterized protein n=1 Tax=Metarhizium guizhouense (strain ARSEF 977) TaxID=1276136 RepID=A0A0B4GVF0_METGA|nr:hypothetical protein MGU_11164 [Metarhizium guizhouense ARSEF 977]
MPKRKYVGKGALPAKRRGVLEAQTAQYDDVQYMSQRDWPLFGTASSPLSEMTTGQQEMILKIIVQLKDDGRSLEDRLDEVYSTLEWWKLVGCEFCFLMGGQSATKHTLQTCRWWHGCDRARSILHWLERLEIPRFSDFDGACSMCTHTRHWCGDIRRQCQIAAVNSQTKQAFWTRELYSKPGPDGHCERKPVMRRVIAAICAFDDQFFGKLLARHALDADGVDLSSEKNGKDWFEYESLCEAPVIGYRSSCLFLKHSFLGFASVKITSLDFRRLTVYLAGSRCQN